MQKNKGQEESKDIHALIDETKSELSEYVTKRLRSFKLRAYEKTAVTGSFVTYGLIILLVVYFISFFTLLTIGYFLGELLGSNAAGFGILIIFSIICLLIFMKCGKKFRRNISNLIVSIIKKIESDEE